MAAELQGCEPGVETGALREPNASLFDDAAVSHGDNTPCLLHGGEPMSDDDGFVGPARDRASAPSRSPSARGKSPYQAAALVRSSRAQ
jgi:hypothetical protein